jgi:protein-disulfide isomerase/uncharacterized membrane protein
MDRSRRQNKKIESNPKEHGDKSSGWFVIILSGTGLALCIYLYSLHVALLMGEIKSGLLCSGENRLGCLSVASSSYSIMMGLPISSWGAIFYSALVMFGLGGVIFWRDCGWAFLRWAFFLAVLGLAFDIYLVFIMIFRIKAICWICVATYIINFVIIITLVKQVWREPKPRVSLRAIFPGIKDAQGIDLYYRNIIKGIFLGGILLTSFVVIAGSQLLSNTLTENDRERLTKIIRNLSRQKPKIMEVKNRPFIGTDDAKLTIVEFSDFLCPYCAKASKYLKLAASSVHDTARFVFRHYPLDKSCNQWLSSNVHPGACLLAEGSVCAYEQNKFWDYHDTAFETKGKISRSVVMGIASSIGLDLSTFESCLNSGRGLKVVDEDIRAAIKARVRSTPTLFINGRKLRGVPKPWMLDEIFQYSEKNLSLP